MKIAGFLIFFRLVPAVLAAVLVQTADPEILKPALPVLVMLSELCGLYASIILRKKQKPSLLAGFAPNASGVSRLAVFWSFAAAVPQLSWWTVPLIIAATEVVFSYCRILLQRSERRNNVIVGDALKEIVYGAYSVVLSFGFYFHEAESAGWVIPALNVGVIITAAGVLLNYLLSLAGRRPE